jgi:predicted Zn-dependent protease
LRGEMSAARELVDAGRLAEAIELLRRLSAEFSAELDVRRLLAHAQQKLTLFEKAQAVQAAVRKCEALAGENRFEQALDALHEALQE